MDIPCRGCNFVAQSRKRPPKRKSRTYGGITRTKPDTANHHGNFLVCSNGALAADMPGTMIKTATMIIATSVLPPLPTAPLAKARTIENRLLLYPYMTYIKAAVRV